MNKSELISKIAENSGLSKVDSRKAVDGFIATVTQALKGGDKIALTGFGSFSVFNRAERSGVNPATGCAMQIPAKNVVRFKAGAELDDVINP